MVFVRNDGLFPGFSHQKCDLAVRISQCSYIIIIHNIPVFIFLVNGIISRGQFVRISGAVGECFQGINGFCIGQAAAVLNDIGQYVMCAAIDLIGKYGRWDSSCDRQAGGDACVESVLFRVIYCNGVGSCPLISSNKQTDDYNDCQYERCR